MEHNDLVGTIQFLRPGAAFVVNGFDICWHDEEQKEPTLEEIEQAYPKYLAKVEADKKAEEAKKQAILDRLGITAEEAKLILNA